jgi:hypothetical protein
VAVTAAPGSWGGHRPSLAPYFRVTEATSRVTARRRALMLTTLRSERADQVAPDRRLAEDHRGAQSTHGGGGMMILRAALSVVVALGLLATPLAAEAQQPAKIHQIGFLV